MFFFIIFKWNIHIVTISRVLETIGLINDFTDTWKLLLLIKIKILFKIYKIKILKFLRAIWNE